MKVIYVGSLYSGSTNLMRMRALERLGHQVTPIDSEPRNPNAAARPSFVSRVMWKLGFPLDDLGVSKLLLDTAGKTKPDLIWVDKGLTIGKRTLQALKTQLPGALLVHYTLDDPFGHFGRSGWRRFLAAVPYYDLHFVHRQQNVKEFASLSARSVRTFLPFTGFDPDVHYPRILSDEQRSRFASDVAFLGAFERYRAESMLALARSGVPVRIWGPWPPAMLHPGIQWEYEGVYGDDYVVALSAAKICLCFIRRGNRDQHNSRSIEIPASGVFMLAERTQEHRALFEEGKEAEFFDSAEELIEKAKYYLAHDRERKRIAAAGRERCINSRYSYLDLMRKMLLEVDTVRRAGQVLRSKAIEV